MSPKAAAICDARASCTGREQCNVFVSHGSVENDGCQPVFGVDDAEVTDGCESGRKFYNPPTAHSSILTACRPQPRIPVHPDDGVPKNQH